MNFKKLIKMVLVGAGIVFIVLIGWNWEDFSNGFNEGFNKGYKEVRK
jgi:DNA-binding transcriptional regulator of glucitol operon